MTKANDVSWTAAPAGEGEPIRRRSGLASWLAGGALGGVVAALLVTGAWRLSSPATPSREVDAAKSEAARAAGSGDARTLQKRALFVDDRPLVMPVPAVARPAMEEAPKAAPVAVAATRSASEAVDLAPVQTVEIAATPAPSRKPDQEPAGRSPAAPEREFAVAMPAPRVAPAAPTSLPAACSPPLIATEPLPAGRMRIAISVQCLAGQVVEIHYGGAVLAQRLDSFGTLDFVLDCFAGTASALEVRLPDGVRHALSVETRDLDRVSKIAVLWRAPVNLDLHAFEGEAQPGTPGHIWSQAASSFEAASARLKDGARGAGFMSVVGTGDSPGDHLEVYTFLHADGETSGPVALALDYEARGAPPAGELCGTGPLAEIAFRLAILPRGGTQVSQSGTLAGADCGKPLAEAVRFAEMALAGFKIRR